MRENQHSLSSAAFTLTKLSPSASTRSDAWIRGVSAPLLRLERLAEVRGRKAADVVAELLLRNVARSLAHSRTTLVQ